jgi:hypothetical protein
MHINKWPYYSQETVTHVIFAICRPLKKYSQTQSVYEALGYCSREAKRSAAMDSLAAAHPPARVPSQTPPGDRTLPPPSPAKSCPKEMKCVCLSLALPLSPRREAGLPVPCVVLRSCLSTGGWRGWTTRSASPG